MVTSFLLPVSVNEVARKMELTLTLDVSVQKEATQISPKCDASELYTPPPSLGRRRRRLVKFR
jgi:competence transcription factor ComK